MERSSDEQLESGLDPWRSLPIFLHSEKLLALVEHIVDGILLKDSYVTSDFKKSIISYHIQTIMENALVIPSRIIDAHNSDAYNIKMENAVLIRRAACEVLKNTQGLRTSKFIEIEYLNLLNLSVEAFRPIFADWVATFDANKYVVDRWGLFNPPGIHHNDSDLSKTRNPDGNSSYNNYKNDLEDYLDDDDLI